MILIPARRRDMYMLRSLVLAVILILDDHDHDVP